MNVQRFALPDEVATQFVDALVVEGAILGVDLSVQVANTSFVQHCGTTGALGKTLWDFLTAHEAHDSLSAVTGVFGTGRGSLAFARATAASRSVELYLDAMVPPLNVRMTRLTAANGLLMGYLLQGIPKESESVLVHNHMLRLPPGADPEPGTALTGARAIALAADGEGGEAGVADEGRAAARQRFVDQTREVLNRLGHGYWEVDYTSGLYSYNDNWYRMRGLDPASHRNERRETWTARLHPDDVSPMMQYLARMREGTADFEPIVYRERHQAGHLITILATGATYIRDADGRPLLIGGSDVDITAGNRLAQNVRQLDDLEQRWMIASEYGKLGLWDHDRTAGTRTVSQTWRQMRGYGPGDPLDESRDALIERIHPDDRARMTEAMDRDVSGGVDTVFHEYRERHREGHYIHILSRGRVIARDADGTATRIIGIDTDISVIKAASDEVRQMSRRLELALATSQVGVWEVDVETQEAHWDDRMMEIYGLDRPAGVILPGTWESFLHPDDVERVGGIAKITDQRDGTFWGQFRIVRRDGTVRHIRARSTAVLHESGRRHLIGVDADVTADVEAEEELRQANALARQRNEDLERARAEMEFNALHDALTGLPNRRYLDDVKRRPRAGRQQIAIMQMDLDRFKQINDTLGHAAGDAVLCRVARILEDEVQRPGIIARIGGDEFVVLLEESPGQRVMEEIAERIIARVAETSDVNGQEVRFGISIGIATGSMATLTADEVMENADLALYEAKSSGRSQTVLFADRMRTAAERKRRLADAILGGLERDEFFCVYQPQFDARTLELSGLEALVRWRQPDGTVETPGLFLSVAEELSVEDRFDAIVLSQVLADQARWEGEGLPVPRVSVNVSARRLSDPTLPATLAALDIRPGRISFELLETVFLDVPDPVISHNISAIRAMGIEIEIDDFGTGHASLVGMLRLQPNRIKIDRQLVHPLGDGEKSGILVRSIIDIGRMHGIEIVAEGVETPEHVRLLTAMGCNYLQGFALALPIAERDMCQRLKSGAWVAAA